MSEIYTATKPTIRQMAAATNLLGEPIVAGDRLPFWNGTEVAYYVITKGDMVKIERFHSRKAKQTEFLSAKIRRDDMLADRERTNARRDEATRRQAAASDAMRMIASTL